MKPTMMNNQMSKPVSLAKLFWYVILYIFVFTIGISWALSQIGISGIAASAISAQIAIFFMFMAFYKGAREEIDKLLLFSITKKQVALAVGAALLFLGINILLTFIVSLIPALHPSVYEVSTADKLVSNNNLLLTIVFPVIIAPFVEELAFRAGFKRHLMDLSSWGPTAYVLTSAFVFGMLHIQPGAGAFISILLTGSIGAINAILYLKTNNIMVPILSHMLYNLIIIVSALSLT